MLQYCFITSCILYCLLLGLTCGGRIDNIVIPNLGDVPYACLVLLNPTSMYCSANIIGKIWVLTAAHCFKDMDVEFKEKDVVVYAGVLHVFKTNTTAAQKRDVKKVIVYPRYLKKFAENDVALLKLRSGFEFNDWVKKIRVSVVPWVSGAMVTCKVTGFGEVFREAIEPNKLDKALKINSLIIKQPCRCGQVMNRNYGKKWKRWLCNEPQDDRGLCLGDSGSGVICYNNPPLLYGVASGIIMFGDYDNCVKRDMSPYTECGSRNVTNVFEEICPYVKWLGTYLTLPPGVGRCGAHSVEPFVGTTATIILLLIFVII